MRLIGDTQGFTLVESLVAFALLALSMTFAMTTMSDSAKRSYQAHETARAIHVAEVALRGAIPKPIHPGVDVDLIEGFQVETSLKRLTEVRSPKRTIELRHILVRVKNLKENHSPDIVIQTVRIEPKE